MSNAEVPAEPATDVKRAEAPTTDLYRIRVGQRAADMLSLDLAAWTQRITEQEGRVDQAQRELDAQRVRLDEVRLNGAAAQEALDLFYLGRAAERSAP